MSFITESCKGKTVLKIVCDYLGMKSAIVFTDGSCVITESVGEDTYTNLEMSYHDKLPEDRYSRWSDV